MVWNKVGGMDRETGVLYAGDPLTPIDVGGKYGQINYWFDRGPHKSIAKDGKMWLVGGHADNENVNIKKIDPKSDTTEKTFSVTQFNAYRGHIALSDNLLFVTVQNNTHYSEPDNVGYEVIDRSDKSVIGSGTYEVGDITDGIGYNGSNFVFMNSGALYEVTTNGNKGWSVSNGFNCGTASPNGYAYGCTDSNIYQYDTNGNQTASSSPGITPAYAYASEAGVFITPKNSSSIQKYDHNLNLQVDVNVTDGDTTRFAGHAAKTGFAIDVDDKITFIGADNSYFRMTGSYSNTWQMVLVNGI